MCELDKFINWKLALETLRESRKEIDQLIRIATILLSKADALRIQDEVFASLVSSMDFTDEQVRSLSSLYLSKVADLKFSIETLGRGEINHAPE